MSLSPLLDSKVHKVFTPIAHAILIQAAHGVHVSRFCRLRAPGTQLHLSLVLFAPLDARLLHGRQGVVIVIVLPLVHAVAVVPVAGTAGHCQYAGLDHDHQHSQQDELGLGLNRKGRK